MTAQETIKTILDYLGLAPTEFAKNLGLGRADIIFDIQRGKTKCISKKTAARIKEAYPAFNEAWLLTGEGKMLDEDIAEKTLASKSPQVISATNHKEAMAVIHRLIKQSEEKDAIIKKLTEANETLSSQVSEKDEVISKLVESNNRLTFAFEKLAEAHVMGGNTEVKKAIG